MGMFGDRSALAALYSAIDSQKRKAAGLFTDPMAHLEMIGGKIKDDPEAFAQQLAGMAGVIKPAYHGTIYNFPRFMLSDGSSNPHPTAGLGVFTTNSPREATEYALQAAKQKGMKPFEAGENIRPVNVELKNPYKMSPEKWAKLSSMPKEKIEKIKQDLMKQGYDGLILNEGRDIENYVSFYPEAVKSVFE